jgi:acyl-CoA synthetase (AMP-forming)/AMP-acid ligase II
MAVRPSPWPQVKGELLPHVLFKLAAEFPDMTYAMFPINSSNISLGYRNITFSKVANAVNAVAWWIKSNIGNPEKADGSETLVYMGPTDIRYAVLCLGAVVAGYKVRSI